jgi:acetolactate synthase I/II/III large subunit
MMAGRKTYEVLAEMFRREGVEACFALLGDANMNWATALAELGTRMIYVRHEHCAVSAATANARKADTVGVATVTCGPGLTQVLTALPAAVRAGIPLVIFAGEAPLRSRWYNQEIDQAPFVTAAGAVYRRLHHVPTMLEEIRDAFLEARMDRKPVVLGIPFDLQDRPWDHSNDLPAPSARLLPEIGPMPPNPADIARAAARIAESRRIIVMGGLGAVAAGAGPACRVLAERCDALLATTLPARGLFHDDPFNLNVAGGFSSEIARRMFAEADLVIAVGSILAQHNTDSGHLFGQAHVLQIDTAPRTVSQGRVAVHSHVRADARLGVEALLAAIPARPADWRSAETARLIRETPPDPDGATAEPGTHHPADVIAALEAALPHEWQMVNSSGHVAFYATHMPSRPQENFLTIREFGAIGNGTSYAIGVATARPDDTVVLIDGDGSVMMHLQELETMHRHGLNILVCILNDGAYGSEIHKLRATGLPDNGAVFGRPDFATIARSFGLGGTHVTDLADLPGIIATFRQAGGCTVLDFPTSDQIMSPVMRRAHPPTNQPHGV